MPRTSLFGHLALQFTASPENLATEALNYILSRSRVARRALIQFMAETSGLDLGDDLAFQTQAVDDDDAIPDLVGFDRQGQQPLVIEAKFWAGLTERQPVAYIRRLPSDGPGIVVFLAPTQRLDLLWTELLRRCQNEGWTEANRSGSGADPRSLRLGPHHALTLVSWRRLLGVLVRELDAADEMDLVSDARQLLGLCERMDSEAFLPLRAEELTGELPRRLLQLAGLVDVIVKQMVAHGVGTLDGRRSTGGAGWYGCAVNVDPYIFFVSLNAERWADLVSTPFWLGIFDKQWRRPAPQVGNALRPLEGALPPRLFTLKDQYLIPLFPPTGVEQDEVVRQLVEQICKVASYLPRDSGG